jgi:hypothetical protein
MFQSSAFDPEQPGFNPVQFERAAQRAVGDLQRVVGGPAQRALAATPHPPGRRPHDELAGAAERRGAGILESRFPNRNDPAVVDAFIRLRDSRLVAADVEEPVDWSRDDDDLPAVYLIVKAMLEAEREERAEAA